ncbi:MAG: hypothetical protein Ct9H300mP28_09910 [Pseudomonadota bacterium]|nr:MAG: hypothetical protein Ct9H300mP28_09910 [Pseudomonadota bacterium]
MHWLSKKNPVISAIMFIWLALREMNILFFFEQGKKDWETILLHRSRELKTGGQLVFLNFCRDENGKYLGNTKGINMFENFAQNWKDFFDQGRINVNEYQRITLPQYYNTVEEFSAPLQDSNNQVYRAGLRLKQIETHITPCPFAESFKEHQDAWRSRKNIFLQSGVGMRVFFLAHLILTKQWRKEMK